MLIHTLISTDIRYYHSICSTLKMKQEAHLIPLHSGTQKSSVTLWSMGKHRLYCNLIILHYFKHIENKYITDEHNRILIDEYNLRSNYHSYTTMTHKTVRLHYCFWAIIDRTVFFSCGMKLKLINTVVVHWGAQKDPYCLTWCA